MNPFGQLAENLDMQLSNYNKLIELEVRKVDALYKNDIQQLTEITDSEAALLQTLSTLEHERIALVSAIGFEGMTMSQILPYVTSHEEKQRLDCTFSQLTEALGKLKDTNKISENLTQIRMRDVELMIKAMAPPPKPVVYKQDGTVNNANGDEKKQKHIFKNDRV